MEQRFEKLINAIKCHWKMILLFSGASILVFIITVQILYPSNRLAFFTEIDGINLSGWQKDDAIKQLNSSYADKVVPVYFGKADKVYISPKPAAIGLTINNTARVNVIDYPWYLRIVPTSILWLHLINEAKTLPDYERDDAVLVAFIAKELGSSCDVKPQDASLKVTGEKFEVVPSAMGGSCDVKVLYQMLADTKPQLQTENRVTIPVKEILPSISDEVARQFGDALREKVGTGVILETNGLPQTISSADLFSWIDFTAANGQLSYVFNPDRALAYLDKEIAPKVAVDAGVTTVSTYDFIETGRVNGASGKRLDIDATLGSLKSFLDGVDNQAVAVTAPVAPRITYTRSYSATDVGISALMQQYAETHTGVYGISLIELSGQNRRASYNETKSFVAASTYKLFVAYSALKRVEDGTWNWSDQIIGSRDLSTCLDDMIVRSDNICAEALLDKIGYKNVHNEAHAIGCMDTSFVGGNNILTTSADLSLFLAQLQTGQILNQQSSRDRLIDAMKRNIFRQGIPTGIGGLVADKVGFLFGFLHDASIVYGADDTYVLVIMTDGSSWATIADFASQIEALRIQ